MPDNAASTMQQRRAWVVRAMLLLVRGYNAAKNLCLTAPIWPVKHDKDMEAFWDMNNKSKSALSLVSPQARHHYTRFDQVNQLVEASEADTKLGFMSRWLALCSLPRTNPGKRLQYIRRNGPFTLGMIAGLNNRLPYGNIPRLLLAWICTEAVRTQSPTLVLGRSLSQFMRKLGISSDSGGPRGEITRLRNQMQRLFSATLQFVYEDHGVDDQRHVRDTLTSPVTRTTHLAWNPRRPGEPVLWESTVELGLDFFNEIIQHPVPVDMNILYTLKRSALGLDLYMWLVYRVFSLRRPLRLSWRALYRQFGAEPTKADDNVTVQRFRKDCLRELKKIKIAWPGLDYRTAKGVLILSPSEPLVPRLTRLK